MCMRSVLGCLVGLAGMCAPIYGQGVLYEYNDAGTEIRSTNFTAMTAMSLGLLSSTRYVDIIPTDSSSDIPKITLSGGPSNGRVRIYMGADVTPNTPGFRDTDTLPSKSGRNLVGLHATGLNGTCESEFYGGITGDFGESGTANDQGLYVDRLVRFDIGGALHDTIDAINPGGTTTPLFIVEAGTMGDGSVIELHFGDVTRVKTTGDMKVAIVASNGNIDTIQSGGRITGYGNRPTFAKRGYIRRIEAAVEISQYSGDETRTLAFIRANEGIREIEAPIIVGFIKANDAQHDSVVTDGSARRIVMKSDTLPGQTPALHAKIEATKLAQPQVSADRIEVFDADSQVIADFKGQLIFTGNAEGRIMIEGSLATGAKIEMGTEGLKNKIIINGVNSTGT